MKKRVLISGGTGFIGRHLCEALNRQGVEYMAMDNQASKGFSSEHFIEASLLDVQRMTEVLRDYQPDAVVHLAAIASVIHGSAAESYNVNVCGTQNLLDAMAQACPRGTRLVLSSSAGVYGNQPDLLYKETLPCRPVNHYSFSKMVMEMLSEQYDDALDIRIVRPFNVIGVRQNESFLVPKMARAFAQHAPTLQLGNLSPQRDFIPVIYAAKVFAKLALCEEAEHRVYNICYGHATSAEEVLKMLEKITGYSPKIEITTGNVRGNEVWRLVGCPDRLKQLMGDQHEDEWGESGIKRLLQEIVDFYKGHN